MEFNQYVTTLDSPLGPLTLASDGTAITGLWMNGQKYYPDVSNSQNHNIALPIFDQTIAWLASYFQGKHPKEIVPLSPKGSPFRQSVWEILRSIPHGEIVTYGEIAKLMAIHTGRDTMSAQAVGGAVGHNPISILIPCHRVVGANGSLTGYAGGVDRKIQLLRLEGVNTEKLVIPTKGTAL